MHGECLLLAATPADAGLLENALRLNGHAVRVVAAPGPDTLSEMLADQNYLAVIADMQFPKLRLRELVKSVNKAQPEMSILAWDEQFDAPQLRNVIECGADGLLSRSDTQLSVSLLEREIQRSTMLKQLQQYRERLGEQARKDAEELNAYSGPIIILQEGVIVSLNEAASESIAAGDPDELLAMPVLDLLSAESAPALKDAMRALRRKQTDEIELLLHWRVHGDDKVSVQMTLQVTEYDGEEAIELRGAEASSGGDSDHAGARDKLRQWLANGRALPDSHPVLLLFGLDRADEIEAEIGLFGLDELRQKFARLLLADALADSQLAPLDNGTLAMSCAAPSLEKIEEWAAAKQRQLSRQIFSAGDHEISITTSVVIYPLPPVPRDADRMLRAAGDALRELCANSDGSALAVSGDAADELKNREKSARWAAEVKQALKDGRFDLAFQSIACLTDDAREHADLLLRLNNEQGEAVPAREFMPAAQDHNLMPLIDRWVVQNAISRLAEANKSSKNVFFVRLDASTLQKADEFLQWLDPIWEQNRQPNRSLVIVLREKMLQSQMRKGITLLKGLQERDIGTAIDHFGISNQSHELLRRLPVDYVKLHADFTAAIADPDGDITTFQRIMEVAKQQGIKTIAERVSSANAMARLWQMGVNFLMGSHVHEPDTERSDKRFRLS